MGMCKGSGKIVEGCKLGKWLCPFCGDEFSITVIGYQRGRFPRHQVEDRECSRCGGSRGQLAEDRCTCKEKAELGRST
jgi:hypothetical protein